MTNNNRHTTLTEQNFSTEVLESSRPVLVDFSADWCAPCRAVAPIVDQLAGDFAGQAMVGKVDVDAESTLAQRYEIQSIPSLLFFRNGVVVDRVTGMVAHRALAEKLEKLVRAARIMGNSKRQPTPDKGVRR